MIIYFKGTSDILGINLREHGISPQLNETLSKQFREQQNLLIGKQGSKSEIFMGSREHATPACL